MKTVVYQSFRTEEIPPWIARCMKGVAEWADARDYDYARVGDEFFDLLPNDYRSIAQGRLPILSDLARLIMARNLLAAGYERTIWVDADVVILDPDNFEITVNEDFSFCREIWVQPDGRGGVKAYRNVHNAMCVFVEGNSFLEFYIDACQRIVSQFKDGQGLVNQIVGPKFLSAIHNITAYPVIENVGMLSPLVVADIDAAAGAALDLLNKEKPAPMQAANLCSSLAGGVADDVDLNHEMMDRVVTNLIANKGGDLARICRRDHP